MILQKEKVHNVLAKLLSFICGFVLGILLAFYQIKYYFYGTVLIMFLVMLQSGSFQSLKSLTKEREALTSKIGQYIGLFCLAYILSGLLKMFYS